MHINSLWLKVISIPYKCKYHHPGSERGPTDCNMRATGAPQFKGRESANYIIHVAQHCILYLSGRQLVVAWMFKQSLINACLGNLLAQPAQLPRQQNKPIFDFFCRHTIYM